MESIYSKILEAENNHISAALCLIIKTEGSTPRKTGTKMIVYADSAIFGTIGGGAIEQRVIKDALEILKDNQPQIKQYMLQKNLNMNCGGYVEVYIEPLAEQCKLYIFGGGHVGKALAKLAFKLNFSITVIDDRQYIFEELKDIQSTNFMTDGLTALGQINFDNRSFVCVMASSHESDFSITTECAKREFAYLGVIGSKRKYAKFINDWIDQNLLTEEQIARIDCPMGIPINCETPEEIAISILAKLIDVRNNINSK